ncbi:MAG: hypothetical protein HY673_23630 [Chloroflexi bacterium]|nr:hypothetical protein [Chloroflexota bacterium]
MAKDERSRQKAIMKKRLKDAVRKKRTHPLLARGIGRFGSYNIVMASGNYPVHECLINPSWQKRGLAHILLSRRKPDGGFVFGVYLVDLYCLGLKNTFCNAGFSLSEYADLKARVFQDTGSVVCEVPLAHRIIYGAIDYASRLGFKPQEDFEMSKHVLGKEEETGPGPGAAVVFGKDGKPFFISGPDDDVKSIIKKLEQKVGPGNFDFITRVD